MKSTTVVKDLVCGMDVDTSAAAGQSDYKGSTYYFCGQSCKKKFDANPEQYLSKSGEAAAEGCGSGCGCA